MKHYFSYQSNILISEIIHKLRSLNKSIVISSHIFSTLNDTNDEIHLQKEGEFIRRVGRDEFSLLENDMKDISIKDRIEKFGLN